MVVSSLNAIARNCVGRKTVENTFSGGWEGSDPTDERMRNDYNDDSENAAADEDGSGRDKSDDDYGRSDDRHHTSSAIADPSDDDWTTVKRSRRKPTRQKN